MRILVLLGIQKAPKERPPNRRFYCCWAPREGGIQRAPADLGRQRQKRGRRPPVRNTIKRIPKVALLSNFSSNRTQGITGGRPTEHREAGRQSTGRPGGIQKAPTERPPNRGF